MDRDEHLKRIYLVGSRTIGKRSALVLMCSGPDCGGAELLAIGLTVAAVLAEANAHVDKMAELLDG